MSDPDALPDSFPTHRPNSPDGRMPTAWHVANAASDVTDLDRKLILDVDRRPSTRFQEHHHRTISNQITDQRSLRDGLIRSASDQGTTVREMIGELAERYGVTGVAAAEALHGRVTADQLDATVTPADVDTIATTFAAWNDARVHASLDRARTALTEQTHRDPQEPAADRHTSSSDEQDLTL